jgi:lysophospholipase L1-like esterase
MKDHMKSLDRATLASLIRGVVAWLDTPEGMEPDRFDAAALDYYTTIGPARGDRARCSAGVSLAFRTTSRRVRLVVDLTTAVRSYSFVDLWVDGVFYASSGAADGPTRIELDALLPDADGSSRAIALDLPHCRRVRIRSLEIDAGASIAPCPVRPVLLAYGDSITQGMNAHHPSLAFASVLARALDLTLLNQGVGGHVFDVEGLVRPPVESPALITVAYGINDWNQGRDLAAAGPWLARLREWYPRTPVFVFEPIWAGREGMDLASRPNARGETLDKARTVLRAVVAAMPGLRLVPAARLLPGLETMLSDGVHPNETGHLVYGLNAAACIRSACR